MMYGNRCAGGNRPPAHSPTDTAGLKCPPEIGPNAYAPVSTVSPNASETPRRPIPTPGKVAASTALPHPPRTSQNVPRNSAASFVVIIPPFSLSRGECARSAVPTAPSLCGLALVVDGVARGHAKRHVDRLRRVLRLGEREAGHELKVRARDMVLIAGNAPATPALHALRRKATARAMPSFIPIIP